MRPPTDAASRASYFQTLKNSSRTTSGYLQGQGFPSSSVNGSGVPTPGFLRAQGFPATLPKGTLSRMFSSSDADTADAVDTRRGIGTGADLNGLEGDFLDNPNDKVIYPFPKSNSPTSPPNTGNGNTPADTFKLPKFTYKGDSAKTMADREFKPQFALLAQMEKDARKNYDAAGTEIGGMYAALADAIRGDAPAVATQYADTGKAIGDAYNQAIASTQADAKASRGEQDAIARRLGVEAAVPAASQDSFDSQNAAVGVLNENKANQQSLNTQLGANETSYNRSEANSSDMAGTTAIADFKQQLLKFIQNNDSQELAFKGQQGAAENNYGFNIRDFIQNGQNQANSTAFQQQGRLDSLAQAGIANDFSRADYVLKQDQLEFERQKAFPTSTNGPAVGVNKDGVPVNAQGDPVVTTTGNSTSGRDANGNLINAQGDPVVGNAWQELANAAGQRYAPDQAIEAYNIISDAWTDAGSGGGGSLRAFIDYLITPGNYDITPGSLAPDISTRTDKAKLVELATIFYRRATSPISSSSP